MDTNQPSQQLTLSQKVHKFSYSLITFVYQSYFARSALPEGINMNFIIPDSDDFVKGIGDYLNLVNAEQMDALRPLCQQVVEVLQHNEAAFISYLKWRASNIKYTHRYKIVCMFALVSHLVLNYFERKCFRFAESAAEAVFEIISENDIILSEFERPLIFQGFKEFCVRTDHQGIMDTPAVVREQFMDFVNNHKDVPRILRKDYQSGDLSDDVTDSSADEDSKSGISPAATSTESSGECTEFAGSSSASAGSSQSKVQSEGFLEVVTTETLEISTVDTENTDSSKSEGKMEVDPESNNVCSLCNRDCSTFLRDFVKKFRDSYLRTQ